MSRSFWLCRADWKARSVVPTATPDATAVSTSCARCDVSGVVMADQSSWLGFMVVCESGVLFVCGSCKSGE